MSDSEVSEEDAKYLKIPAFNEARLMRLFLKKMKDRHQHIICSIIFDKQKQQLQSFSRGEAFTIFQNCTDFWDGVNVVPITDSTRTTIKELLHQWKADNLDTIGFSYKPVLNETKDMIEDHLNHGKPFDKQMAKGQTEKCIFLGLLGFKNQKRSDTKRVWDKIEDAGIRPVLFSKEDMIKTIRLGADLGIDTQQFNLWISLSKNS